jgi:O-antigen/teichoic acid export membrane protein
MSTKRLLRNAVASLLQVVFSAGALLLMYRLLTQHLTISQIGLWSLILGSTAITRLAEFGLGAGVLRFVAGDIGAGRRAFAARTVAMATASIGGLISVAVIAAYPVILPLVLRAAPPELHEAAHKLLVCALCSVVLGSVGNVFLSAIDGCQRMDVRAGLQLCGNLVQLVTTFLILPRGGLAALGYVQIAQAGFLLVAGAAIMFTLIGCPLGAYIGVDRKRFWQLVSYGGSLQVAAIAQLLFEPLTKILLTTFGGLALTGYFDVANRMILQLRAIIIAAYTAMVPYVAAKVNDGNVLPEEVKSMYLRSSSLLLYVLLPYFACVAAALPLALTLWIGHFDPMLLGVALIQFVGWSLNSLNTPAYYLFLALGRMRAIILSHVLIGLVTAVVGSALGWIFGGAGVLVAASIALLFGSAYVVVQFHRKFKVRITELFAWTYARQIGLTAAATVGSALIATRLIDSPGWPLLIAPPVIVGGLALTMAVRDPFGREMLVWARRGLTG